MAKTAAKAARKRAPGTVRTQKTKSARPKSKKSSVKSKESFAFPSRQAVKQASKGSAQAKKLTKTYKSAGYRILGTTSDGIVIVRPPGKPRSFELHQLNKAVAGTGRGKLR
jgi:hypothetical protein